MTRVLTVICIVFACCESKPSSQQIFAGKITEQASPKIDLNKFYLRPAGSYEEHKRQAVALRKVYQDKFGAAQSDAEKQAVINEASTAFSQHLLYNIIPFWYGTPWDFNGYTPKPGEGVVACGYFVSTTLLHCGVNINRYSLAQQNPRIEAITLNQSYDILSFSQISPGELKHQLLRMTDGLYFVGLDFHVGYLLKENKNLFFIHSNYIEAEGVVIEPVDRSAAFRSSYYYVGEISTNAELIRKWILNEPTKIYEEPDSDQE